MWYAANPAHELHLNESTSQPGLPACQTKGSHENEEMSEVLLREMSKVPRRSNGIERGRRTPALHVPSVRPQVDNGQEAGAGAEGLADVPTQAPQGSGIQWVDKCIAAS